MATAFVQRYSVSCPRHNSDVEYANHAEFVPSSLVLIRGGRFTI